jgi:GNAT superfamily N-acetyltransferase
VRIRQLGSDDVDTLRTIRLEALATDPDAFGSTLEREEARSTEDWVAWLGRGATFVGEDDAGPTGLVVAVPHEDPRAVSLYAMFVTSRARRQGLGAALVEAGVRWAASMGAERVTLMVIEGNTPAATLYEACGFAYTGDREVRDRDGAVELEMARVIRSGP